MVKRGLVERMRVDLAIEMGETYARSVERCLKGEFEVAEDDMEKTGLLIAFRQMVVEIIAKGMDL